MYEPLIIPEHTDWMACMCKSVRFTHWTPGRSILIRNAYAISQNLAIKGIVQVELLQTIHTMEISSLRLSFCKKSPGNKTRKLVYPPPQERPKTLDLLCHTGGCHFDCHSNDLKFSLITCYSTTLLCNIHWGEPERAPHSAANTSTVCFMVRPSFRKLY